MSLKYKTRTTTDNTSGRAWLLLFISIIGAFLLRNNVSSEMFTNALDIAGPTLPFLVFLISYMLTIYWRVFILRKEPNAERLSDVFHAEDMGDVAATLGLIGTIIAMVSAANTGEKLDVTMFLQSLISTLIGISAYAVSKFFSSTFERVLTRRQPAQGNNHAK
ncbi:hypothetical protein [Pseudoalteromonas sp. C12FD-1]|uniref:hypothetical protein n=1 Tax=Pseudoalteromonas sp. C12FD-1 TaxID=3131979 RepID=UPI00307F9A62